MNKEVLHELTKTLIERLHAIENDCGGVDREGVVLACQQYHESILNVFGDGVKKTETQKRVRCTCEPLTLSHSRYRRGQKQWISGRRDQLEKMIKAARKSKVWFHDYTKKFGLPRYCSEHNVPSRFKHDLTEEDRQKVIEVYFAGNRYVKEISRKLLFSSFAVSDTLFVIEKEKIENFFKND